LFTALAQTDLQPLGEERSSIIRRKDGAGEQQLKEEVGKRGSRFLLICEAKEKERYEAVLLLK